jgi:hypothetical protein
MPEVDVYEISKEIQFSCTGLMFRIISGSTLRQLNRWHSSRDTVAAAHAVARTVVQPLDPTMIFGKMQSICKDTILLKWMTPSSSGSARSLSRTLVTSGSWLLNIHKRHHHHHQKPNLSDSRLCVGCRPGILLQKIIIIQTLDLHTAPHT